MKLGYPAAALMLLACGGDAPCVFYPCPQFEAVTIAVSSTTGAATIPALTYTQGTNGSANAVPCGADRVCHVFGGTGTYQLTISAPGYAPKSVSVQVTGADAGCNTCGHIDRQQVSVVLQPQS